MNAEGLYKEVCKWYALTPPLVSVVTVFMDAPFGRFALSKDSKLQLDGIKSWITMELVSPLAFLYGLLRAPLADAAMPPLQLSLHDPRALLALLYLVHYANRALLSPLRTPGRSKAHISVPLSGILFNIINGTLMGTYLASPACTAFLLTSPPSAFARGLFYVGLALWAAGFAGNVLHDEVLLNIRRDAQRKQKQKEAAVGADADARPHYGIPRGYLYCYVSYPNYLCEWVEWAGFALAAAPIPALRLGLTGLAAAAPPWLFFFAEVFLMAPRAYKGHMWYHAKFPEYPKERRAVIPFVL